MRAGLVRALVSIIFLSLSISSSSQAASAATNAQKALALAASGCQKGSFDTYKYQSLGWIIIYSSLQHRINTVNAGTFEITQIGLDSINHIEESWASAGSLDKKWSKLLSSYENALETGLSSWSKGEAFGPSLNRGLVKNEARINSLCKIANFESASAAKKMRLTQKSWIVKTAGSLLPKVVRFKS